MTPARARLEYAFSSLGIIDLMAFLPSAIALTVGDRPALVLFGMLPFFKLVRYSPALRSLLAALHAERRTLFGCVVILTGAVLLFATLLYAIEHKVQPDKFGTIPQAMWWAIVTLGTVGYGDVVPVTPLGKIVSVFAIVVGFAMIALPVAIVSRAFTDEVRRRDFIVTWAMLARVPLFSHLGASEIVDIMRLLRAQTIEAGEVLVRRGDPASSMYFITAGEVEIELPSQRVRLSNGTFFGEIALLHRTKRSGTVTATRKTKLLALDAQDFHALIERLPDLASPCEGYRRGEAGRYGGTAEGRYRPCRNCASRAGLASALAQEHVVCGVGRVAIAAGLFALALEFAARRIDPLHRGDTGEDAGAAPGGHGQLQPGDIVRRGAGGVADRLADDGARVDVFPVRPRIVPADGLAVEQQRRDRLAECPGQLAVAGSLAFIDLRAFGVEREHDRFAGRCDGVGKRRLRGGAQN